MEINNMEKIIIDDVDVSKCKYLIRDSQNKSNSLCGDIFKSCRCKEIKDCYYKQLQRMDKGYGELMEENARILAKLEKAEFENRKLKRENQELRDNYVKLDLQRIKEIETIINLESEEK